LKVLIFAVTPFHITCKTRSGREGVKTFFCLAKYAAIFVMLCDCKLNLKHNVSCLLFRLSVLRVLLITALLASVSTKKTETFASVFLLLVVFPIRLLNFNIYIFNRTKRIQISFQGNYYIGLIWMSKY